jgi:hypothetical protein
MKKFKSEDDFNAYLTAEFKKIRPVIGVLKMSAKFHIGVADYFLTRGREAVLFESKLIREFPKRTGLVLNHPFDGTQQSFLRRFDLAGTPTWGLIGCQVNGLDVMWPVPLESIPSTGNWKRNDFLELVETLPAVPMSQVGALVDALFGYHPVPGMDTDYVLKSLSENT